MHRRHTTTGSSRTPPVYCAHCGRDAPLFVPDADGRACCLDCISKPTREAPWDADDRRWFTDYPWRKFRLRPVVAGEPCLRDVPDASERIAEARQSGCGVAVLVWWDGSEFVRQPGTFGGEPETMESLTDAGIERWAAGR